MDFLLLGPVEAYRGGGETAAAATCRRQAHRLFTAMGMAEPEN